MLEKIDVAVMDVVMPALTGPDANSEMCTLGRIPVVLTAGYTAEAAQLSSVVQQDAVFFCRNRTS
jgi:CheY-like chemotaxis protein